MQDRPSPLPHVFHRAERYFGHKQIVTATADGETTMTVAEWAGRVRRLATVLDTLGISADGNSTWPRHASGGSCTRSPSGCSASSWSTSRATPRTRSSSWTGRCCRAGCAATIRAHHPQRNVIDIDFVLHADAGPATRWAQAAEPGDTLAMFGPSSSFARPIPISTSIGAADCLLLAGDETALPAISSLIESLPERARAVAYIEVSDAAEEQQFDTRGEVTVHWLYRGEDPAGRRDVLIAAVRDAEFPSGSVLAWPAGESGAVRAAPPPRLRPRRGQAFDRLRRVAGDPS